MRMPNTVISEVPVKSIINSSSYRDATMCSEYGKS